MIKLLACFSAINVGFALLVYLTMRRAIRPQYKAFIYGALTFALLVGIFLTFQQYDQSWKSASVPGQPPGEKRADNK